jgi:hypothetical protein
LVAEGIGWIDYDQDGDVDLVSDSNGATRIFQNNGAGTFAAVFPPGLPGPGGLGDYLAVGDVDADGDVDIVDRKDTLVDLYVNNGDGTFSAPNRRGPFEASTWRRRRQLRHRSATSQRRDFDVVWTYAPQTQVWLQTGFNSRVFTATGQPPGLGGQDIDGVACPDIDNDGDVDLILNGSSPFVFQNNGAGTFTNVTPPVFVGPTDGEGVAVGDYDRDCDMDVLANLGGGGVAANNVLGRNETNDRNYLMVRALTNGRDAIGATASLFSCTGTRVSGVREVNGGEGHGTQGPLAMHFGLPTSGSPSGPGQIYEVRVQFVGGTVVRRALRPIQQGCYQEVTIRSTDTDDLTACTATAVRLLSFTATGADGAVDLAWRTGSEVDNLGFHVHRSRSANGPWTRVTSSLIPGLGFSAMGQSYSWRDPGLENGVRYFYRLEDVDAKSGRLSTARPRRCLVSATPRPRARATPAPASPAAPRPRPRAPRGRWRSSARQRRGRIPVRPTGTRSRRPSRSSPGPCAPRSSSCGRGASWRHETPRVGCGRSSRGSSRSPTPEPRRCRSSGRFSRGSSRGGPGSARWKPGISRPSPVSSPPRWATRRRSSRRTGRCVPGAARPCCAPWAGASCPAKRRSWCGRASRARGRR